MTPPSRCPALEDTLFIEPPRIIQQQDDGPFGKPAPEEGK
jgi:hypothetical protein